MQDNQLHGNLTVEEAMAVATALKLPSATTSADKEEVVSVIDERMKENTFIRQRYTGLFFKHHPNFQK